MSDYKSIVGKGIKFVSSNLDNDQAEGQIWYNSTDGKYRDLLRLEAWSSGTILTTKRYLSAGTGSATAGLVSGGDTGSDTKTGATEEYNGNGWSNGGSMNTLRAYVAGSGTQTASLGFSGYTYPPPNPAGVNASEEYDGSTWTSGNPMNVARFNSTGCGTQSSALGWAGRSPASSERDITEEYNGTNWTTGGTLSQTKTGTAGAGNSQDAGLCFGGEGSPGNLSQTEEYNGSSWTTSGDMILGRRNFSGSGTQTAALGIAGYTNPPGVFRTNTESYDGTTWSAKANVATARMFGCSALNGTTSNTWLTGGRIGPSSSLTANTEEYNSSLNVFTAAAWASGSATNTALGTTAGSGSQTAAIIFSGANNLNNTELYNGIGWTTAPTLNTGRYAAGEATNAPQTAALCFGGYSEPPNTNRAQTEEYDGSSWSEQSDLPTGIRQLSGFGTQTAAVSVSGWSTDYVAESYEYNGASWTAAGNINVYRERSASFGLETAGVTVGGNVPPSHAHSATVEEYNGASWTTATAYPTGIKMAAACGIQTDGLVFSGNTPPNSVTGLTLGYDGTSWSTRPSMATARQAGAGAGTSTAALMSAGANVGGTSLTTTEEFTGQTTALNVKTITTS